MEQRVPISTAACLPFPKEEHIEEGGVCHLAYVFIISRVWQTCAANSLTQLRPRPLEGASGILVYLFDEADLDRGIDRSKSSQVQELLLQGGPWRN